MNRMLILPALVVAFLFGTSAALAGSKKDEFNAVVREWTPLARAGDADAQFILADLYEWGIGGFNNDLRDEKTELQWLTRAAEQGDVDAQRDLAGHYLYLRGDLEIGLKWFKLAAEQGNVEAQNHLYLENFITLRQQRRQRELLEKTKGNRPPGSIRDWQPLAEQGNAFAQFNLARFYEDGIGIPVDKKAAWDWYIQAAEQGYAPAQMKVGDLSGYLYKRLPREAAIRWYRLAAEQGHPEAQNKLGELGRDKQTRLKWFERAAAQGYPAAAYNLGWEYKREKSYKTAIKWFTLAAQQGGYGNDVEQMIFCRAEELSHLRRNAELSDHKGDYATALRQWTELADKRDYVAQYELGEMHYKGRGVPQDFKAALKWFKLSAKQGGLDAIHTLGSMYHIGRGVPKNLTTAAKFHMRAAKIGSYWHKRIVGSLYEKGEGVLEDHKTALRWYRLAALKGDPTAQKKMEDVANWYRPEAGNGGGLAVRQSEEIETRVRKELARAIVEHRRGNFKSAFLRFKNLAEQGHLLAQTSIAIMYLNGEGVPKNTKAAFKWFKLAAEQGHSYAQLNLGIMNDFGQGIPKDPTTAAKWYKLAAKQGVAEAQYHLAYLHYLGQGVPQDYKTAVKWYKRSAKQGYALAQNNLGSMYARGEGVPQNFKTAAKWYRLAAEQGVAGAKTGLEAVGRNQQLEKGVAALEQGDYATVLRELTPLAEQGSASAQEVLGLIYHAGKGVQQNYKTAAKWYKLAGEQGRAVAQYNLGSMLFNGEGVLKDANKALKWFTRAAEQGHASAQFNLGLMYGVGDGVSQDLKVAERWIRRAAADGEPRAKKFIESAERPDLLHQRALTEYKKANYAAALLEWRTLARYGYPTAQFILGVMYNEGKGVRRNYEDALKWYRLAAEQGFAEAQYNLGLMFSKGHGVPQDHKTALNWYKLAAEQGFAEAQHSLGLMYFLGQGVPENRDTALEWAKRAAKQGHAGGQDLSKTLLKLEEDLALNTRLIDIEMRQLERSIDLQEEFRQLRREVRRNANTSQRRPFFPPVPADRFIIPMPEFCTWETVNGRQYCLK